MFIAMLHLKRPAMQLPDGALVYLLRLIGPNEGNHLRYLPGNVGSTLISRCLLLWLYVSRVYDPAFEDGMLVYLHKEQFADRRKRVTSGYVDIAVTGSRRSGWWAT